jgi:uncharacterized protein
MGAMTLMDRELTGNDHVSIPHIGRDGGMDAINVLHGGLGGLVEWLGSDRPLLMPEVSIGGERVVLEGLRWRRLDRWIPVFTAELPQGLTLTGTICAPGGYPSARGCLVRLEIENTGRAPLDVEVGLRIEWRWTRHWIATARPLPGANRLHAPPGGSVIALETDGGRGPALAVDGGLGAVVVSGAPAGGIGLPTGIGLPAGPGLPDGALTEQPGGSGEWSLEAANGEALHARVMHRVSAVPRRRMSVTFFIGAGRERDGAIAAAAAMRAFGADHWIRQARLDLSYTLRAGHDHRWSDLLNRNLLFNRYYATGRGIDDDRLYLLRSRSPRCPAPALFNEREALFWTLPALVLADPGLAREALFRVFDTFSERSGEFRRYIDGGTFDSGFCLDQCLLYAWAVDHYVVASGDTSVLGEPLVHQVLMEIDGMLFTRLHPEQLLCSTELLPSGEPADHPYTTTGNVLLWWFCEALPRLLPGNGEEPPRFAGAGAEVAAAIWQHCVAELGGTPVFASSADLAGDTAVYEDPVASLALLPFLGFCTTDDPVWAGSLEFMRSDRYPLWRGGAVPGLASRSDPAHARLASLCADLLGPAAPDALDRLLRIRLPGGLAAAAYDADGTATEPENAALAGLLAWTLVRAAEPPAEQRAGRKKRR